MKTWKPNLSLLAATLAIVWSLNVLSASAQTPTPQDAAAKMRALRAEIAVARSNIVLTLEQLHLVRSVSDPAAQLQKFNEQLAAMEKSAGQTREHALEMKTKGDAYFSGWEAPAGGASNAEQRRQDEAKQEQRKKSYDRIMKSFDKAGKDFEPLLAELKEIQKLLEGKPTPEQITQAKDWFMRANWHCADVQQALLEAERELDTLAAGLSDKSGTAAPATKSEKPPVK